MAKQIELSKIRLNAKERLLEYVQNNDVEGIIHLVEKEGTNILQTDYEKFLKPILHIACHELANTTLPLTINTLIDLGADMYKPIRSEYQAIHSAIKGQNPDIVKMIIAKMENNKQRLNATAVGSTALNMLVKSKIVNAENFEKCLRILLDAGIDVNKADNKMVTPILWAAQENRRDVVKAILECGRHVDIDRYTYRNKTARTYIAEKSLYDGKLPVETCDNNENMSLPFWYILNKKEEEFLQLEEINVNEEIAEGTLLQLACQHRLLKAVTYLLDHGADVCKTTKENKTLPLVIAAKSGCYKIFDLLVGKYDKIPDGIPTTLFTNVSLYQDSEIDYQKCLNTLLEQKGEVPINEYSDTGNTPLHYSGLVTDPNITLKLLDRGASLANENKYKSLPVEDLDPKILEQHFDKCVTLKQFSATDKRKIVVSFDYASLIPTSRIKEEKSPDCEASLFKDNTADPVSETGVISVLSTAPEMRHLLLHPLISSFIFIKWHRMRWFFRINFILFSLFGFSFFAHVFIPNKKDIQDEYRVPILISWIVLIGTYILLICREVVQLFLSPKTYCRSWSNGLEVLMLITSFCPIFYMHKALSSIALIFIALEFMVLLSQHPTLCTYMVMLRTVAKTFFYFLAWYAILIFAFVLSFYNLFNKNGTPNLPPQNTTSEDDGEEKEQEFFNDLGLTLVKTIVMLTGEFDASSIDFDSFWNRIIFLVFVFMIPIILFNLLNGLAVSDTQQIKNEAELVGYVEMVSYIVYMENLVLGNAVLPNVGCLFANCWGQGITPLALAKMISLVPDYLPEKKMDILVYDQGLIIKRGKIPPKGCIDCRLRVDSKTVKRVKLLLNERSRDSEKNREMKKLNDVISYQDEIIEQYKREIERLRTEVKRQNSEEIDL